MSETIRNIEYLQKIDCFKKLKEEELFIIAENSKIVQYKRGETIFKQSVFSNNLVFFVDGLGKTYLEGSNDKNIILEIIKPFELVGITSLYGENTYHFSVASISQSNVFVFDKFSLHKIIDSNTELGKSIIELYCKKTKHFFTKIISLGNKQLHGRFADALLYLSNCITGKNLIDIAITRKEIGELAGISTESAIRLLSELNHDGIINLEGKSIEIIKIQLLQRLSEIG